MHQPPFSTLRLGLAPMEGVSELPLRLWMSQTSAPDFMSTPFLRATATYPRVLPLDFAPELTFLRPWVTYPLIPQVMTGQADEFLRAAELFLEDGAPWVDLNAGCPSPNPISGGAGSGLLRDPEILPNLLSRICAALPPHTVSLKMRTGFEDTRHFETSLDALRHLPLKQLTLHGRTRRDRYDGHARWELMARAAEVLPFPVVASGDIVSYASLAERRKIFPEVRSAIIGRGALRNPWLFEELRNTQASILDRETLLSALAVLGLLFQAYRTAGQSLLNFVQTGIFLGRAGTSREAWEELYQASCRALLGATVSYEDLAFDRQTMGRLKMLYNSLRSSLPIPFREPTLMRVQSFGDWVQAWQNFGEECARFTIRHDPSQDWLYTSSRRQAADSHTKEVCHD